MKKARIVIIGLALTLNAPGRCSAQADETEELVRVLADPASSRPAKEKVLDRYLGFEPRAARALRDFLRREPDSDLRLMAGFRLDGAVSYLEHGSPLRPELFEFLTEAKTVTAARELAAGDAAVEMRTRMIHFMGIVMFPFGPEALEPLAALYVPALLDSLGDPDPSNRSDVLWALNQHMGTRALRSGKVRQALLRFLILEQDERLKDNVRETLDAIERGSAIGRTEEKIRGLFSGFESGKNRG